MAIPRKLDGDLAGLGDTASTITTTLQTMNHASARDVPGLRARLRENLQTFVDQVMDMADEAAGR